MNDVQIEELEKIREHGAVRNVYEAAALDAAISTCKEQKEIIMKLNDEIKGTHSRHLKEMDFSSAIIALTHGDPVYAICLDDTGHLINCDPLVDLTVGEALDGYRFLVDKEDDHWD